MTTSTDRFGGTTAVAPFLQASDLLVPGAQLASRYRLGEPLLRRPDVAVWSARDVFVDDDVELSILLLPDSDVLAWQGFATRAQTLRALDGPGIARVTGSGTGTLRSPAGSATVAYMVSRPAPGVPLTEIPTGSGELAVARTLDLLAQAARALAAVHAAGVVHGRIQRSSFSVARQHRLTIVDFPLHFEHGPQSRPVPGPSESDVYLAPELWRPDRCPTVRSDVYALGVVAFECLAGRRPFGPEEAAALAAAPWGADPPELPQDLAADIRWVVASAMRPDPQRRFSCADQFADALEDLTRLDGPDATPMVTLRRPIPTDAGTASAPEVEPPQPPERAGNDGFRSTPSGIGSGAFVHRGWWTRDRVHRLGTLFAIGLVFCSSVTLVRIALQMRTPAVNRMVLHLVDGAAGSGPAGTSPTLAVPQEPTADVVNQAAMVRVPDLVGHPVSLALTILRDQLHLQIQLQWQPRRPGVPNATVLSQTVNGVLVPQGTLVRLTIAGTPVSVPGLPVPGKVTPTALPTPQSVVPPAPQPVVPPAPQPASPAAPPTRSGPAAGSPARPSPVASPTVQQPSAPTPAAPTIPAPSASSPTSSPAASPTPATSGGADGAGQ